MSFVNVFGGTVVQPADISYTLITLTANTTLSWPTQFPDPNSLLAQITTAQIMDVLPSAGGFTLTLPPANQVSVGQTFLINNISGVNSFTLLKNDGSLLSAFPTQTLFYFYLIDNSTIGGTWRITPWGLGVGTVVTSVAAVATTAGLTITGSPITSSGTFNFSLSDNLVAVSNVATTGFQVVSNNAPATWVSRSLVAGSNISITDPDGVAANPTISLNTAISGITSLTIGNIQISGQTITTTNANLDLILAANGTGTVQLANNLDANSHSISNVTTLTSTSMQGGNLSLAGNALSATNVNGGIQLNPNGSGSIVLGTNLASSPIMDSAGNFSRLTSVTSGTLTATSSINVGNLVLSTNVISSTANSNIVISPNGTGIVSMTSGLLMNTKNISGITDISADSGFFISIFVGGNIIPIPRYSVLFAGATGAIISGRNVASVVRTAAGRYSITLSFPYGTVPIVLISIEEPGGGSTIYASWSSTGATNINISTSTGTDPSSVGMVAFY